MTEVELIFRKDGSTKVIGDVVLKDHEGNIIIPPRLPIALCRCGASNVKPFCDGSHKVIGWTESSDAR